MKELTALEQMILVSILGLKEDAYGVSIRIKLEKLTGKRIRYGSLYNALDQLLRKGYITKRSGTASPVRAGRPRIYYSITRTGKEALRAFHKVQQSLWSSIPDFIGD